MGARAVTLPQVREAGVVVSTGVPPTATLRIGVLGEMTAVRDGAVVDLGGPRQRAVLGLLVLARGDVVPADRLIDALWADGTAERGQRAAVLRLPPAPPARAGPAARATGQVSPAAARATRCGWTTGVDAWRFERLLLRAGTAESAAEAHRLLDEALALWRGPAFADYVGQAWADAEAAG